MNKKFISWQNVQNHIYEEIDYSSKDMLTLSLFLNDGIGIHPFINFLLDETRTEFFGNISKLKKDGDLVVVNIDENIYPHMPSFTTSISNLIRILKEFKELRIAKTKIINLTLDNDELKITI